MRKKALLNLIYDILGSLTREIIELKLGMIEIGSCVPISQDKLDDYLENN